MNTVENKMTLSDFMKKWVSKEWNFTCVVWGLEMKQNVSLKCKFVWRGYRHLHHMDLKYSLKDVFKAFEMNGLRQILGTKFCRLRKYVGY